jgi:hypothetical protein
VPEYLARLLATRVRLVAYLRQVCHVRESGPSLHTLAIQFKATADRGGWPIPSSLSFADREVERRAQIAAEALAAAVERRTAEANGWHVSGTGPSMLPPANPPVSVSAGPQMSVSAGPQVFVRSFFLSSHPNLDARVELFSDAVRRLVIESDRIDYSRLSKVILVPLSVLNDIWSYNQIRHETQNAISVVCGARVLATSRLAEGCAALIASTPGDPHTLATQAAADAAVGEALLSTHQTELSLGRPGYHNLAMVFTWFGRSARVAIDSSLEAATRVQCIRYFIRRSLDENEYTTPDLSGQPAQDFTPANMCHLWLQAASEVYLQRGRLPEYYSCLSGLTRRGLPLESLARSEQ